MTRKIFCSLTFVGLCLISLSVSAQNGADSTFPIGTFEAPEWTITFMDDGHYEVALMDGSSLSGTFEADGDQVKVKDSMCGEVEGVYTWKYEEGALTIEIIEDNCYERRDASGVVMRKIES